MGIEITLGLKDPEQVMTQHILCKTLANPVQSDIREHKKSIN